jgi:hypothetical protein
MRKEREAMLDWKRFADEVPTEARAVVLCHVDNEGDAAINAWVFWRGEQRWSNGVQILDRHDEHIAKRWRSSARAWNHTHWAYVDPPEDA